LAVTVSLPTTDDRLVWDIWLSMWWMPSLTVADELRVFDTLAAGAATPRQLAESLQLDPRGAEILMPLLASLGFLVVHDGRYGLTEASRNFLLHASPFYWGGVFARQRTVNPLHAIVKHAVRGTAKHPVGQSSHSPPVEAWEQGQLDVDQAREVAQFMQSHSAPAAAGLAVRGDFGGVARLLDVGGGSGCFSIALARQHADLRCTVMDLPAMCTVAREYIASAGASDRVDVTAVDMFRSDWPPGFDAIFLSNVFHDWSTDTCARLAASAYRALPHGGRIYVHEMLMDDAGVGPRTPAAFSMLMLVATRGRQFTSAAMAQLLADTGFVDIEVTATYGYYSLIRGVKD
jgi:SAM-dependent methyltransferase